LAFLYAKLGRYNNALAMWERILEVMINDYHKTEGNVIEWPKSEIAKLKAKL
jgi:hypothetical protein